MASSDVAYSHITVNISLGRENDVLIVGSTAESLNMIPTFNDQVLNRVSSN